MSAARRLLASGIGRQLTKSTTKSGGFFQLPTCPAVGELKTCASQQSRAFCTSPNRGHNPTMIPHKSWLGVQVRRSPFQPCARSKTIPLINALKPLLHRRWMRGHRTALERTAALCTQLPRLSSAHQRLTSRHQVGGPDLSGVCLRRSHFAGMVGR